MVEKGTLTAWNVQSLQSQWSWPQIVIKPKKLLLKSVSIAAENSQPVYVQKEKAKGISKQGIKSMPLQKQGDDGILISSEHSLCLSSLPVLVQCPGTDGRADLVFSLNTLLFCCSNTAVWLWDFATLCVGTWKQQTPPLGHRVANQGIASLVQPFWVLAELTSNNSLLVCTAWSYHLPCNLFLLSYERMWAPGMKCKSCDVGMKPLYSDIKIALPAQLHP